jgi:hypothetical protein
MNQKGKSESKMDINAPLSPEADKYLGDATAEFNAKQEALQRDWRFGTAKQWRYDQYSAILKLEFDDGAEFAADGQILGSYMAARNSWEWAWNNPHVEEAVKRDSRLVKQLGERLDIEYLVTGMVPAPTELFASYLSAIGVKATDSIGAYRGKSGPVDIIITLKNPRWTKKAT